MSKLWDVHNVLNYSWRLGLHKIIVETDNATVTNIFHGKSKALADCALVASIHELLARQLEVQLHRISRTVADRIAALMCGRPLGE
ncbi:hypothetical protein V6N11_042028 [Hibiscus sabdariffa]|uniref:RNase H type-1 domain-containing protein n=1 Tax=Hibiscus sabdariffa TaxID=183260 RepID=A0ABR2QV31_9ROSI